MTKEEILRKVKNKITNIYPSAKIILYGSRARDDYKQYSDWDFIIIFDNNISFEQEMKIKDLLYDLELETGEVLCSIIHSKKEWKKLQITPFYKNVSREGIVL